MTNTTKCYNCKLNSQNCLCKCMLSEHDWKHLNTCAPDSLVEQWSKLAQMKYSDDKLELENEILGLENKISNLNSLFTILVHESVTRAIHLENIL